MKLRIRLSFLLLLSIPFQFSGCGLFDRNPKKDEELPPATQTGANTVGCLVNGNVWLPKGYDGTSNLSLSYDPSFMGGAFNLQTYRYYAGGDNDRQNITIYSDSLSKIGLYTFYVSKNRAAIFSDWKRCTYQNDSTVTFKTGSLNITRLDLQQRIVSGTFEFTVAKSNCDTINITQGRFDIKL